jgi:poly(hydroxyalkanoate) granule associated protein phasin
MLKTNAGNFNATRVADAAWAASRQVWLAGLGAATITRQWAASDAGQVFRSLVKEGEGVENRARRVIGKQVGNSLALATSAWNTARHTAMTTVSGLVDVAAATVPALRASMSKKAVPAKAKRRSPAKTRNLRGARRAGRKV